MATLVDQTLLKGVKPSQISVLVYYTGQLTLVTHKILMKAQDNGRSWDFSEGNLVSSVDSFQGEENEFVFIDIVTAHQEHHDVKGKGRAAAPEDSEEEDGGGEAFKKSGRERGIGLPSSSKGGLSVSLPAVRRSVRTSKRSGKSRRRRRRRKPETRAR